MISLDTLTTWLASAAETEHLELKEARSQFDAAKLVNTCCALANEGGGHLVLGVSDRPPRQVVGTSAFGNLQAIKLTLLQKLHLRIEVSELAHRDGRVPVFSVPPRPIGMPIAAPKAHTVTPRNFGHHSWRRHRARPESNSESAAPKRGRFSAATCCHVAHNHTAHIGIDRHQPSESTCKRSPLFRIVWV